MATKDRIYIDKELVQLADQLVKRQIQGSDSVQGVFRDTRELAVFAAGLGYRKKRTRTVTEQGREVKLAAVERIEVGGSDLVSALSVAVRGNVAVLTPDRALERAEIFEQYVNGGLDYIAGIAGEEGSDLAIVAHIVKSEHAPREAREEVLDLLSQRL
jgi:dnd system-associated protein 4